MPDVRSATIRGRQIRVWVNDDGEPAVTVDGEDVPVRMVGAEFAVAYLKPQADLLEAARSYAKLLD